jgi:lysophospholipase L1-like esterase
MGFLTGRLMRTLRPGVAATLGLGSEFRRYWEESNERARQADGPLWVAVGDSTAQGIGASAPDRGYVGQLLVRLQDEQRREMNQIIRADAPAAGLRIADAWAHTGPPWQGKYAADDFHPNDTGYGEWCAAFAEAIGLDGS